jgi:hypothetical protein
MDEFEKEIWLFIDKDLPEERMLFWKTKLKEFPQLELRLQESLETSEDYDYHTSIDITESSYNRIIDLVTKKKSLPLQIFDSLTAIFKDHTEISFGKIAFGSTLALAAIIILLISGKPNPVSIISKNISSEILDWNGDAVENKKNEFQTSLKVIKDEDLQNYYLYKLASDEWKREVIQLGNSIKKIKKELDSKSL